MIGTINVRCNAAKPNFPLQPMFAFMGSPSSIRVLDVPKSIGTWEINSVRVAVLYPNNLTIEKVAVRTGSVWVATIDGCEVAGKVGNGLSILADGIDEDGNEVSGYVLGKGDVFILEDDSDVKRLLEKYTVRYLDEVPASPSIGDLLNINGQVRLFDGERWLYISNGGEPTFVYDSQITIQKNGTEVGSFTTNSETPVDIDIPVPSRTSDIENDVGFITASAIPSQISSFENDVGYITASEVVIPSNLSDFNNDVGYITASAIPSSYSSISDASGNVINANRTIQRTAPGVAAWKLTQGGVTQTMTGTRTDSECEITVNGQLWKNHLEWYVDQEYGQEGWKLTQYKWNGSGWGGGQSDIDFESEMATSLSFHGYDYVQVTINWEEEQVIVSDTLVTQSQLSTMRSMTDLSYEQSFDKNNLEGIVSFNVVETSAPLTTIVLDKYDAASQTWSGDTQDWKVMWYYEGMGQNVMFQLYNNNIGVQAFQAPAQGAGTTSWTFYGGGSPVVSGTLTMNMSDSLMTTNPVKALIDSETKDKRDYNDISYYATPTTYSAYTYGIDKFTIETGWSNIWSADTSSAQVSGSTTTWALNNGLGVLTSDGQTFSLELSGSAIGTSFTMEDLKKGGVIQTTTIDTDLSYQVTANAQFFKTTFALKDYVDAQIGSINTALDTINGEVI